MRIALINENSQAAKNEMIYATLKFEELFFANCKCDKIAEAVKEILA